jgi:hypothetical protein
MKDPPPNSRSPWHPRLALDDVSSATPSLPGICRTFDIVSFFAGHESRAGEKVADFT